MSLSSTRSVFVISSIPTNNITMTFVRHLALKKHAPIPRHDERVGRMLGLPIQGGLHHQYVRV